MGEGSAAGVGLSDRHGDVYGILAPASGGSLAGTASYTPFGQATWGAGIRSGLGYQGEWTDPASGRVDMHARWYAPDAGRFVSRDSWTIEPDPSGAANRYGYADADPLDGVDPSGHFFAGLLGAAAAVAEAGELIAGAAAITAAVGTALAVAAAAAVGFGIGLGVGYALGSWLFSDSASSVDGRDWSVRCTFCSTSSWDSPTFSAQPAGRTGSRGGSGAGQARAPQKPRVDPRKALVRQVAMTPAPRPPSLPGISQAELDARREAVESKVQVVAATQALRNMVQDFIPTDARTSASTLAAGGSPAPSTAGAGGRGSGGPKRPVAMSYPDPDDESQADDEGEDGNEAAEDVGGGGTSEDLYHFGRSPDGAAPIKGARHEDFGISNDSDVVGPYTPSAPTDEVGAASTFIDAERSGLTGHYYRLPAGTDLPEELAVHADGEDVGGLQPWGHRSVYPRIEMPYAQFQELFRNLPWEYLGRIK